MTPAEYARRRKRGSPANPWRRHQGIESVQPELAWIPWFAGAACGVLSLGLALRAFAYYKISVAIGSMEFEDPSNADAIVASVAKVTSELGKSGDWLLAANVLFLLGVTSALLALWRFRFRAPWYGGTLACLAVIHLCVPILGTILGAWFLWYYFWNRRSFVRPIPILPSA
jgi:hypothetical protein